MPRHTEPSANDALARILRRMMHGCDIRAESTRTIAERRALKPDILITAADRASLPGKPDFAFPEYRIAVFVDGCFWHGCPECYVRPKSNQTYWDNKLRRNKSRDAKVNSELKEMGWTSIRIWEHSMKLPAEAREIVANALNSR